VKKAQKNTPCESTYKISRRRLPATNFLEHPQDHDIATWLWENLNTHIPTCQEECLHPVCDSSAETFRHKTGIVGLGPLNIQLGDHIYLLPGAKTPFVLRQHRSGTASQFEVVGDCHAHGLMNGEAIRELRDILFHAPKPSWSEKLKRVTNSLWRGNKERAVQALNAWEKGRIHLV
jgi:hypothetical protein